MSGLCADTAEVKNARAEYAAKAPPAPRPMNHTTKVFVGLDGSSMSTKAVAISPGGDMIRSSYRLSYSDPIIDAVTVLQACVRNSKLGTPRLGIRAGCKSQPAQIARETSVKHRPGMNTEDKQSDDYLH